MDRLEGIKVDLEKRKKRRKDHLPLPQIKHSYNYEQKTRSQIKIDRVLASLAQHKSVERLNSIPTPINTQEASSMPLKQVEKEKQEKQERRKRKRNESCSTIQLRVKMGQDRRGRSTKRVDILNISEKTLPLIERILFSKSTPKLNEKTVQIELQRNKSWEKKQLKLPTLNWKLVKGLGQS